MVPVVLVHPPAVADSHQRREDPPAAVVGWARVEDLAVGGLVPKEGELGKDQAQAAGQQQLQPGVLEQDHSGRAACQCQHQHCEDHHVEAAAATLQPSAADGLGQLGERVGKRLVA